MMDNLEATMHSDPTDWLPGLYAAYIDEIPDLTTTVHEIIEPITAVEIVTMWTEMKRQLIEARNRIKELEARQ